MKLVSIDSLKLLLEKEDDVHDDILNMIIEFNSKRIEGYINRKLEYGTYVEYFSGGHRTYFLSSIPVEENTVKVYYENSLLPNSDYKVWLDRGIIEFVYVVSNKTVMPLKIEYKGGYKADDYGVLEVPLDLKYACLLQSSWDFRNRDTHGFISLNLPDGSVTTRGIDLLPSVKQILRQYRLPPMSVL